MRENLRKLVQWLKQFLKNKFHYTTEDTPYYIIILVAFLLFVGGVRIFFELAEELAENELTYYDNLISDFVTSFRTPGLTTFFRFVTDLGDRTAYIILTTACALFFWFSFRNWLYIVQIISVQLLSVVSNVVLKRYIHRTRPHAEHLVDVNTLSFPSGHSMSAMAFYGFLIYLCLVLKIKQPYKILLVSVLTILILLIGISRIYLGVHFPSDVAAGFAGGLIWVTLCAVIFNITTLWISKRQKQASSF